MKKGEKDKVSEKLKEIFAEDPDSEQWQMILHFGYLSNIEKFFKERKIQVDDKGFLETISGSIMQAQEYFNASKVASLHTSPLLLYYGVSNLMLGISSLMIGSSLTIENHGMRLELNKEGSGRIADVEIRPFGSETGALSQFCKAFYKGTVFPCGDNWTILEILGSIPELKPDFENCYPDAQSYTIPVQIVRRDNDYLERINPINIERFENRTGVFAEIENFRNCYLLPETSLEEKYIILRRKIGGREIGVYSVSGQKFLQISHVKGNHCITLPTIIYMYMGLFAFGHLSRYHPERWSPFVRSDSTGEKQLIEKFIDTSRRYLPNLALNHLHQKRIRFVNNTQGALDLSNTMEEELKEMIQQELRVLLNKKRGGSGK